MRINPSAFERQKLEKRIILKEIEAKCVRILSHRYSSFADMGRLFYILDGALGIFFAIVIVQNARQWGDELSKLENELITLRLNKSMVEAKDP